VDMFEPLAGGFQAFADIATDNPAAKIQFVFFIRFMTKSFLIKR
jgi:hypothetical protein